MGKLWNTAQYCSSREASLGSMKGLNNGAGRDWGGGEAVRCDRGLGS